MTRDQRIDAAIGDVQRAMRDQFGYAPPAGADFIVPPPPPPSTPPPRPFTLFVSGWYDARAAKPEDRDASGLHAYLAGVWRKAGWPIDAFARYDQPERIVDLVDRAPADAPVVLVTFSWGTAGAVAAFGDGPACGYGGVPYPKPLARVVDRAVAAWASVDGIPFKRSAAFPLNARVAAAATFNRRDGRTYVPLQFARGGVTLPNYAVDVPAWDRRPADEAYEHGFACRNPAMVVAWLKARLAAGVP